MTTKVIMPQMGESVYEGTLTKWLKSEGDTIVRDEPLFEISTDKVDSEIPSPESGTLSEILVPEGETVQINTVLAIIKGNEETDTTTESQDTAPGTEPQELPQGSVPEPAPDLEKDLVNEVSIQSMPSTPELQSPTPDQVLETVPGIRIQAIRTSPLVRKIARENKVDLADVEGTGLEGRITKEDILNYIDKRSAADNFGEAPSVAPHSDIPEPEDLEKPETVSDTMMPFMGEAETVLMSPMRKAIAAHMVFSKRTSAHVNTVFEVDLHSIVQLRQRYKEEFEKKEGIALTYTPFFAKALIDTIREFPILNASLSGNDIVYKKPVNLGIAVALETGLIVPVIKNAQLKSLTGIALKIADLADRARTKRLKPEDVQDGTISITNPGRYGALFATPIISQPQVAILGIGGVEKRPVVINDAIAIRPMVCLSLSYDHRIIDGAVADQFMAAIKEKLQSWIEWSV